MSNGTEAWGFAEEFAWFLEEKCREDAQNIGQFLLFLVSLSISIGGMAGNAVALSIFTLPTHRSAINVLISSLALSDICFLLTGLLATLPFGLYYLHGRLCPFISFQSAAVLYLYPLNKIAQTMSVGTHVCIAFERFVAVVFPFKAGRIATLRFSLLCLAVVFLLSLAFNLSRFWESAPEFVFALNGTSFLMTSAYLQALPLYEHVYTLWLDMLFMYLLPFVLLAALNCKIALTIRKAQRNRSKYAPVTNSSTVMPERLVRSFHPHPDICSALLGYRLFRQSSADCPSPKAFASPCEKTRKTALFTQPEAASALDRRR